MSRSYKKYAGEKDRDPFMKNYANRRLRRILVDIDDNWINPVPCYGGYRKKTDPWNICDWYSFYFGGYSEYRIDCIRMNHFWTFWEQKRNQKYINWNEAKWRADFEQMKRK